MSFNVQSSLISEKDYHNLFQSIKRNDIEIFSFQESRFFSYQKKMLNKLNELGIFKSTKTVSEAYESFLEYKLKGYQAFCESSLCIGSKYPIVNSKSIKFDFKNDKRNNFIKTTININGKLFNVFNIHLFTPINVERFKKNKSVLINDFIEIKNFRKKQIEVLNQYISASSLPVILMGDFNTPPHTYLYKRIKGDLIDSFSNSGFGFGYSYFKSLPLLRIDYIFASKNIYPLYSKVITFEASDHKALISKVRVN